jgi:hypothetical protein
MAREEEREDSESREQSPASDSLPPAIIRDAMTEVRSNSSWSIRLES